MHVIFEGIELSGKDTILKSCVQVAREKKLFIFDCVEYTKKTKQLPDFEDFRHSDVILTAEPTYAWVGAAIREEIIRNNSRGYGAGITADAYSIDRLIHYQRILLPALETGKLVLQSRGAPSSFCYQPIQEEGFPLERIVELEGNQLALEHPPDILLIAKVEPEESVKRMNARVEKQDDVIFDKIEFLKKLQPRYEGSEILPTLFNNSAIFYFDTNEKKVDETVKEARDFALTHLF